MVQSNFCAVYHVVPEQFLLEGRFQCPLERQNVKPSLDTHQYPTEIVKLHMSSANAFRPPKNALCWKLAIEFFEKSMGCKNPEKKIYKEP